MKWKCESGSRKDTELYRKQKIKEQFNDDQPERSKREDSNLVFKEPFSHEVPKGLEKILNHSYER